VVPILLVAILLMVMCRNLSLEFTTRAKAYKVMGQKGNPRVKESVRE